MTLEDIKRICDDVVGWHGRLEKNTPDGNRLTYYSPTGMALVLLSLQQRGNHWSVETTDTSGTLNAKIQGDLWYAVKCEEKARTEEVTP